MPVDPAPTAPSLRARRWTIIGAVLLFTVATAWMTRPLAWNAASYAPDQCDCLYLTWALAWETHILPRHPTRLFEANIFYPARHTLALSEHMLGVLPMFVPVAVVTRNPLLALNAISLSSFVLAGLATAWLAHYYTRRVGPSLAAGFVFAFTSARLGQMTHPHLFSIQWLPLAIYCADRFLREGGSRHWLGFTIFTLWQFLNAYALAYIAGLAIALYTLVIVWRIPRTIGWRRPFALLGGIAVTAAVMVPLTLPYVELNRAGILASHLDEAAWERDPESMSVADPIRSYLTLPEGGHSLYSKLLTAHSSKMNWEKSLFPGFLPVATIVLWLIIGRRTREGVARDAVVAFVAVLIGCWIMSLGPWLSWNDRSTHLRLPAYWLGHVVPGLSGVRAWPRFGVGVAFALALLFAIAAADLTRAFRPAWRATVAAVLILVAAIELDVAPLTLYPAPPRRTPAHDWLAEHGEKRPLLALPLGYGHPCQQTWFMYGSTAHWLRIGNGYSGYFPSGLDLTTRVALELPAPDAVKSARRMGLRWLLVDHELLSPTQRAAFDDALEAGRFVPRERFGSQWIYDLAPRA